MSTLVTVSYFQLPKLNGSNFLFDFPTSNNMGGIGGVDSYPTNPKRIERRCFYLTASKNDCSIVSGWSAHGPHTRKREHRVIDIAFSLTIR